MHPPLKVLDLDVGELRRYPDALSVLCAGDDYAALVVRGVYSASVVEAVVDRLDRNAVALPSISPPYYRGRQYGRIITCERELTTYFEEAALFPRACEELFAGLGAPDYLARLHELLQTVAGSRAVEVARNERGQSYQPYSIREMLPGGSIELHYENEGLEAPSLKPLADRMKPAHLLSAYLALRVPEEGGELCLYALGQGDPEMADFKFRDRKTDEVYAQLEALTPRVPLLAGPGDMLLFDAGRYFHRVTQVRGARSRWTMGSFLGPAGDANAWYYYA